LPGAAEASAILTAARRTGTWQSYGSKVRKYLSYCLDVVPAAGHRALRPVPASQAQILAYLGWLLREETVSAGSLQGYLSAISSLHQDLGFASPTVGKLMVDAKRGFAELEAASEEACSRRPLPCSVILQIVELGLRASSLFVVRAAACVALNAVFFCRADTGVHLREEDVQLGADAIHLREQHLKNVARGRHVLLSRSTSPEDPVLRLLHRYRRLLASAGGGGGGFFWRLPGEGDAAWSPALVDSWLQHCLRLVGAVPPPGALWSSHSLRSGGATGAHSIGVQDYVIRRWGVWASQRSLDRYIDALEPPSRAAYVLFNHLLRPSPAALQARWGGGGEGGLAGL
jgi:hypothetical protein